MALPTASALHRAMACTGSVVLPQVQSTSAEATRGHVAHRFLEEANKRGLEAALEDVPAEHRPFCEVLGGNLPLGPEYSAEVGLLYDVETETVRPRTADATPTDSEVGMRIDVVGVTSTEGHVIDYKTGRGWVPRAPHNWQLRVAALALSRWKGLELVQASIIRLSEDAPPMWDTAEFDAWDLDGFASDLRVLKKRIEVERQYLASGAKSERFPLRLNMGEHCKYCPAFTSCPAQGTLIRRMAGEPEAVADDVRALLTPETASKAYQRVKLIREAMKAVERALHAYAEETPIVLPDGTVFGPTERQQEELDAAVVRQVLAALHGPEVAEKACTFDTSKAGIERALRGVYEARKKAGDKVTIKGLTEQVLEAVREAGGAERKVKVALAEHKVA